MKFQKLEKERPWAQTLATAGGEGDGQRWAHGLGIYRYYRYRYHLSTKY